MLRTHCHSRHSAERLYGMIQERYRRFYDTSIRSTQQIFNAPVTSGTFEVNVVVWGMLVVEASQFAQPEILARPCLLGLI